MEKKLKIIIADDEQNICDMFRKLIRFDEIGLELAATATDGQMLYELIKTHNPDIVVTDICMPKMDGLQVIQKCRENQCSCRFVVVSGYRQFEYAYNALKYNVSDYLLKPVDEQELNLLLQKIVDEVQAERQGTVSSGRDAFLQNQFISYLVNQMTEEEARKETANDYEKLNRTYFMHVHRGYFRYVFMKLDDVRSDRLINEEQTSILEKMKKLVLRHMQDVCYDIAFRFLSDAIVVLLNYAPEQDGQVQRGLEVIFDEGKSVTEIFHGLHLTIAVGNAVEELADVSEAKRQAMAALFSRLCLGTNRIIYAQELRQCRIVPQCESWKQQIRQSLEQLDAEAFSQCVDEMFSASKADIATYEFAITVYDITKMAEKIGREIASRLEIPYEVSSASEINRLLNTNVTLKGYQDALKNHIGSDIAKLADWVDKKRARPIRTACSYIQRNYNQPLRLDDVARVAGLSPAYFSTLFAKTTGQTFSDYAADVRIQKACEFLEKSDMNVSEIAQTLGFPDVRYFSKLFRKKIGIKPTDYRKIYG